MENKEIIEGMMEILDDHRFHQLMHEAVKVIMSYASSSAKASSYMRYKNLTFPIFQAG